MAAANLMLAGLGRLQAEAALRRYGSAAAAAASSSASSSLSSVSSPAPTSAGKSSGARGSMIDIGVNLLDPMFRGCYREKQVHESDFDEVLERGWAAGVALTQRWKPHKALPLVFHWVWPSCRDPTRPARPRRAEKEGTQKAPRPRRQREGAAVGEPSEGAEANGSEGQLLYPPLTHALTHPDSHTAPRELEVQRG